MTLKHDAKPHTVNVLDKRWLIFTHSPSQTSCCYEQKLYYLMFVPDGWLANESVQICFPVSRQGRLETQNRPVSSLSTYPKDLLGLSFGRHHNATLHGGDMDSML